MDTRLKDVTFLAAGALVVYAGLAFMDRRAGADEPPPSAPQGELWALASDAAALQARLEAGERLTWKGPAHRQTLVLRLGQHALLLERGLRDLQAEVSVRREGALLVVEGPATLRREQDKVGARQLDATTLLGLPWGAPPDTNQPPAVEGDSRLQMIEGDASIARPAAPSAVSVNTGEQAPLVEKDTANLNEFAEGKVEVGGSELTLLEHTSLRVLSIGETSSVVEVLGVQLELQRGTIIEAAFGSLVLNIRRGAAIVRPGSAPEIPQIRITNVDPGTGIMTTTTVTLAPGQEFGAGPTGVWSTPGSASPVQVSVTLSVPVYDEAGNVIGRETVTSFEGQAPVGTAATVPVLVDAIARVMATSDPTTVGPLVEALANGTSVDDLGLASLVTNYTGDPALVAAMTAALNQLGTGTSSGGAPGGEGTASTGGEGSGETTSSGGDGSTSSGGEGSGETTSSGGDGSGETTSSGGDGSGDTTSSGGGGTTTIEVFFVSGGTSTANRIGSTPQSIDQVNSQNSTGKNTIIDNGGSTTGTVSPTSSAAFR